MYINVVCVCALFNTQDENNWECEVWTYLHMKSISVLHLTAHSAKVLTEYIRLFSERIHAPSVLE